MVKLRCWLRTILLIAIGLFWFSGAMADLSDGLVAYYPFNGNANDESGNGNDGTVHGATLSEDRFGNADSSYRFDGKSYIDVGNGIHPTFFTVSAWINPFLITSYRHSIVSSREAGIGSPGINEGFVLALPENTNGKARIWAKVVGSWESTTDGVVLKNGWTFLAGTFDGQKLRLFRNGGVVAENSITGSLNTTPERTIIGARASFDNHFFDGVIDEVRIYNRALTESEIQQLYQMNNQPSDNCWATYKNGNLHIPCIKVKGPFDDDLHYEADMQYEPLSDPMTFQVTGVKAK